MSKSQAFRDRELAYKLYQQEHCLGITENAVLPKDKDKENYKPRTLIDQTLELIDPTPNIYTLFMQFNQRYFWNVLLPVEVRWSPRMTSCAGICSFHPRSRQCVISLSAPLLKLRPRKDLVETLLHEMIHGYLFLTNNNRDRDGHGPEFCKHMNRINKEAGTKITIYHSFHDEVKLYQQHWWRCNGPCQKRAPYFGMVRRSMNRAPGPNDFWWKEHQLTCGGQFIKIKEPENYKARGSKSKPKETPLSQNDKISNVFNWLINNPTLKNEKKVHTPTNIKSNTNDLKKLGNAGNNVYGWGTGGPNNLQKHGGGNSSSSTKTSAGPLLSSAGVLGGANLGRSNLLDKFYNNNGSPKSTVLGSSNLRQTNLLDKLDNNNGSPKSAVLGSSNLRQTNLLDKLYNNNGSSKNAAIPKKALDSLANINLKKPVVNTKQSNDMQIQQRLVECPICSNFVPDDKINTHVDSCLLATNKSTETNKRNTNTNNGVNCPESGNSLLGRRRINTMGTCPCKQPKLNELRGSKKATCPICNKNYDLANINEHLDKCLLEKDEQNNSIIILNDSSDQDEQNMNKNLLPDTNRMPVSPTPTGSKDIFPSHVYVKDAHQCLVCNQFIPIGTSLNDHLEDCIGNVFNDESTLIMESDNDETLKLEVPEDQDHKYPCPVCMQLITDTLMNEHLDACLTTN